MKKTTVLKFQRKLLRRKDHSTYPNVIVYRSQKKIKERLALTLTEPSLKSTNTVEYSLFVDQTVRCEQLTLLAIYRSPSSFIPTYMDQFENIMKIRKKNYASKTNMSDTETPTQRIGENLMTDICAATMCEVQNII